MIAVLLYYIIYFWFLINVRLPLYCAENTLYNNTYSGYARVRPYYYYNFHCHGL